MKILSALRPTLAMLLVVVQLSGCNDTKSFAGEVVGVTDGDTIGVMRGGKEEKVRLHGIDCPEMGQAYGSNAKAFTSELAFGKTVEVRERGKDGYGRTIGDVVLPDGRLLNHQLVEEGLAWWYRKYAPGDKRLEELERGARESRTGLWADADPTPPWDYRN
ncbi:MAG: thermonuclease family protein [Armatimonadetes bacterium]|nr:thermonuclease family protein [Armatimonadota bacterium]